MDKNIFERDTVDRKMDGWSAQIKESQIYNGQRSQMDKRIQRWAGQTDMGPEGRLGLNGDSINKRGPGERWIRGGRNERHMV